GPHAVVDFLGLQVDQSLYAHPLDGEGAERGAVDHCTAEMLVGQRITARQVADEAAGECIARTRWIVNVLEREARRVEDQIPGEEHRAVLPLLDDHHLRAMPLDPARGAQEVVIARQLACLAVVHHQQVYARQQFQKRLTLAGDPEIHGVAGDKTRRVDLPQHVQLKLGVDVAENDVPGVAEPRRQLWLEIGEHAEPRLPSLATVQVVAVDPRPAEALAGTALDTAQIDAALLEEAQLLERVVVADHPDELDRAEQ